MGKISALTEMTSVTTDDLVYVVNSPGGVASSKKVAIGNLVSWVIKLSSDPDTAGWGVSEEGKIWYNLTDHKYKGWNGSEIILIG